MATKKMAVKKKAPKKAAPKKAVKKAATKKVEVKKETPVKKAVVNKELEAMLSKIKEAKQQGKKSLVVYTTKADDHKPSENGFGVNDLKPKLLAAYKQLFCQYNLTTKLVSVADKQVEWVIKF